MTSHPTAVKILHWCAGAGTKDFLPEDMRVRSWLFGLWSRVSEQFGFEMVEGPVLESEELFTRKAGEEIVDQLYNFEVGTCCTSGHLQVPALAQGTT